MSSHAETLRWWARRVDETQAEDLKAAADEIERLHAMEEDSKAVVAMFADKVPAMEAERDALRAKVAELELQNAKTVQAAFAQVAFAAGERDALRALLREAMQVADRRRIDPGILEAINAALGKGQKDE